MKRKEKMMESNYNLHLLNDDLNNHLDVQLALMEVCNIDASEAEAFTLIAHVNGDCPIVENIEHEEAKKFKEKLEYLGIQTQITDIDSDPL
jgi:ATP-dependent Clp protease adapter protein ClpS